MRRNPPNNYEEYFRDHRERESEQWRNQTPMESFNQPPHESEVWTESLDQSFHTWTDFESFANDAFCQSSPHSQHQEDEEPESPEVISMLLRVLEDREKKRFEEIGENLNRPTLYFDSWEVECEIKEVSNDEDMDVQDAQFPLKEEIEEIPKDADMTLEGEVMDVFSTDYEIVVEHKDDQIYRQQQSPAGEEVVEFTQLHEDALDEDALALIVAVMNKETLRYNNASTNETNKEEEEVFQLYELPQKELHHDEVVEPRVPGSPTPRLQHPQGLRKRLEWRIKHKWKIKPRNV